MMCHTSSLFWFPGFYALHEGREQGANCVAGAAGKSWARFGLSVETWAQKFGFATGRGTCVRSEGVTLAFGTAGANHSSTQDRLELRKVAQVLLGFGGDPKQASRTHIALVPRLNTVWSMNEPFSPFFFWLSTSEFLALVNADDWSQLVWCHGDALQ